MSTNSSDGLTIALESRCPYCGQADCVWNLSTIEGAGSAEVRSGCGQALSADALLGRIRWHLEAGIRTLQTLRALKNKDATQ